MQADCECLGGRARIVLRVLAFVASMSATMAAAAPAAAAALATRATTATTATTATAHTTATSPTAAAPVTAAASAGPATRETPASAEIRATAAASATPSNPVPAATAATTAMTATGSSPIRIALRPQVTTGGPVVLLGEVADLTTPDLALLRRLASLSLGGAPQPGRVVQLTAARLREWVRRQLGSVAALAIWSGAEVVIVAGAVPAVSRGGRAALAWRVGPVALETRVEVLQDGQPGQTVRVRPIEGSVSMLARVVGPGRLEGIEP